MSSPGTPPSAPRVGVARAVAQRAGLPQPPVTSSDRAPRSTGRRCWRPARRRRSPSPRRSVDAAVQALEQKDGHLLAGHGRPGTVPEGVREAAAGDALGVELLDPGGGEVPHVHVGEDRSGRRRRNVIGAVLGLQEKDGHLRPGHRGIGAVVVVVASARHAVGGEGLDLAEVDVRRRNVDEGRSRGQAGGRIDLRHHLVVDAAGVEGEVDVLPSRADGSSS